MENLYPLLFKENFFEKVWGGQRLKPFKGLPTDSDPIGESWEVSAVPGKESIAANGFLAGKTLSEIVSLYPESMLGHNVVKTYGPKFPLLIKFIDAKEDLSIQVHPNDELAMQRHGTMGKTEMWYIVEAQEGACLYSGFNQPISKYEYERRVEDGSICEVLAKHHVKKGDVVFIPAGRIHAIGGGILLAEIQENSDITYRIFDYNRPGLDGNPRELHTEMAKDAIDFKVYDNYLTLYQQKLNKPMAIAECPYFTMKYHDVTRPFHRKLYKYDSFIVYMCIEGNCRIVSRVDSALSVSLHVGQSCLVPACIADIDITPDNPQGTSKVLEVYIDNKHFNRGKDNTFHFFCL